MKKRRKAYDEIRKQYPETISKDQFYRIAHQQSNSTLSAAKWIGALY